MAEVWEFHLSYFSKEFQACELKQDACVCEEFNLVISHRHTEPCSYAPLQIHFLFYCSHMQSSHMLGLAQ